MLNRQLIGLFLGPLLSGLLLLLAPPEGLTAGGMHVAAVTVLMAVRWVSEAVPIPATALLPIDQQDQALHFTSQTNWGDQWHK